MKGPFKIVYLDFFGLEHITHVWAQTAKEAIKAFEKALVYPIREIVSVEIDVELWRKQRIVV